MLNDHTSPRLIVGGGFLASQSERDRHRHRLWLHYSCVWSGCVTTKWSTGRYTSCLTRSVWTKTCRGGGNQLASSRLSLRQRKVGGKVRRPAGPDAERLAETVTVCTGRSVGVNEFLLTLSLSDPVHLVCLLHRFATYREDVPIPARTSAFTIGMASTTTPREPYWHHGIGPAQM